MKGKNVKEMRLWAMRLLAGTVFGALALCLVACGAENPNSKKEVSKSEEGKKNPKASEAEEKNQRREDFFRKLRVMDGCLVTDYCIYENIEDIDCDDEIVQKNRQGKELARHKMRYEEMWDEMQGGSGKRLLYSKEEMEMDDNPDEDSDDEGSYEQYIYQIPIRQSGASETLLWDKQEKLTHFDGMNKQVYLQEPYLVYLDEGALLRLDLNSGEKKKLNVGEDTFDAKICNIISEEDVLYLHDDDYSDVREEALYRIDIEKWQAEKIFTSKNREDSYDVMAIEDVMLFLRNVDGGDLECYDIARKKQIFRISVPEIEAFLDREQLYGDKKSDRELNITGIYPYGDRVYVDYHILFDARQKVEGNTLLLSEDDKIQRLISFPKNEPKEFRYEKELMDCWQENVRKVQEDHREDVIYSDGIFAAFENELYFSCKGKKKEGAHIMVYDLDTKKMTEVGKEELAYQVLSPMSGYVLDGYE